MTEPAPMSTEVAQRRLLEAIARRQHAGENRQGVRKVAFEAGLAAQVAISDDRPGDALVFTALAELVLAVDADQREAADRD